MNSGGIYPTRMHITYKYNCLWKNIKASKQIISMSLTITASEIFSNYICDGPIIMYNLKHNNLLNFPEIS